MLGLLHLYRITLGSNKHNWDDAPWSQGNILKGVKVVDWSGLAEVRVRRQKELKVTVSGRGNMSKRIENKMKWFGLNFTGSAEGNTSTRIKNKM